MKQGFERSTERSLERWAEGPSITASIWRYKWMVLASAVVFGLAGFVLASMQSDEYEASARLFLTSPGTTVVFDRQAFVPLERYLPQQAQRVTSPEVLTAAAERLDDGTSPAALAQKMAVEINLELVTLMITATDGSPERAAELANAVSAAYQVSVREAGLERVNRAVGELEQSAAEIEAQIAELSAQTNEAGELPPGVAGQVGVLTQRLVEIESLGQQLLVDARVFGAGVDFVEDAAPPEIPVAPRPRRTAIMTAFLAVVFTSALAYWLAGRRKPVVSRDDPAEVLGVPLLGILPTYNVPEFGTLAQRTALEPSTAEAYRFVYSSLTAILRETDARSVMVTSASPGQGKTETALQIAATAQRRGQRVLLIDAELRMRGLSTFLRADRIPGLIDLAEVKAGHEAELLIMPYEIEGHRHLDVLTAGRVSEHDGEHLSESWFGHAFGTVTDGYDLSVVDSPPLLAVADTATIAGFTDAIVLVVREGAGLDELQRVQHRLRFVRQRLVGYVYLSPSALDDSSFDYGLARNRAWSDLDGLRKKKDEIGVKTAAGDSGSRSDEAAEVYQRWFGAQNPSPPPPKGPSKRP
jgi:Mrp family chromosome partitioning ATPase/capsular polysaccharide biosynthesis protein